ILIAFIWGVSFVAQAVGMEHVGPYTFNASRFLIGGLVLLPLVRRNQLRARRENGPMTPATRKTMLLGGLCCGLAIFVASTLQQVGVQTPSPGKAGFITGRYIVTVRCWDCFYIKSLPCWSGWASFWPPAAWRFCA